MPEEEFELYLSLLSRFLRLQSGQRTEIAAELRDHLEERLDDLMSSGLSREAAILAALDEFGGAAELAKHFTRAAHIRKRRLIMRFTLGTVAVLAAGLLIVSAFWPQMSQAPVPALAEAGPPKLLEGPKIPAAPAGLKKAEMADPQAEIVSAGPPVDLSRNKRDLLYLQHSPTADIAIVLQRFFGKQSGVQIEAVPVNNSLLFSAPPELFSEIGTLVSQLDRPAAPIAVEVTVVEFPIEPAEGETRKAIDLVELAGPVQKVRLRLQELQKAGRVQRLKRLQMLSTNNQLACVRDDDGLPGGTTATCVSRISENKLITMELSILERTAAASVEAEGKRTFNNGFGPQCQTTLSITEGQAVVAGGIERASGSNPSRIVFIVSAETTGKPKQAAAAAIAH